VEVNEERKEGRRPRVVPILRAVALFACLLLFAHTIASSDLPAAWARIRAVGPAAALILLPFPFALASDTAAWKRLLLAIGRRVPFWPLFRVRVAMEAITNSAPAGQVWADAISPILVARSTGVPVTDVIAASTAKRWLLIRMHGAYVTIAAALGFAAITRASEALVGGHWLFFAVLIGALVLVLFSIGIETVAARGQVAGRISARLSRTRFSKLATWIADRRHHFENADAQLTRLSRDAAANGGACLRIAMLWFVEGFETFLILRLLGAPLGFVEVLSFDAALSVVRSAAVFAPAGIGVQDVGYLTVLDAYGVPDSSGIGPAFVVLKRLKEAVWIVIGLVLLARGGPRSGSEIPGTEAQASPAPEPVTTSSGA
jgi:glycosyltransferase 2 family protein